MARRDGAGVRLLTRNGYDFAGRFPLAAAAVSARSCLIDGEAIVTDQKGLAVFDLILGYGQRRSFFIFLALSFRILHQRDQALTNFSPLQNLSKSNRGLFRRIQSSASLLASAALAGRLGSGRAKFWKVPRRPPRGSFSRKPFEALHAGGLACIVV